MQQDPVNDERVVELREEQLVARKEIRQLGEVEIRTEIDTVPARLEVDAFREEVEIEHEPIGQTVSERRDPWQEDDTMIVPVYEEQLVVSKRLVLKEHLRIRRVRTSERQLFEDQVRRERLVVDDEHRMVREQYPTDGDVPREGPDEPKSAGVVETIVRKIIE